MDRKNLYEYNDQDQGRVPRTSVRYIEAQSSQVFFIWTEFAKTFRSKCNSIVVDVCIDGEKVTSRVLDRDECSGRLCATQRSALIQGAIHTDRRHRAKLVPFHFRDAESLQDTYAFLLPSSGGNCSLQHSHRRHCEKASKTQRRSTRNY